MDFKAYIASESEDDDEESESEDEDESPKDKKKLKAREQFKELLDMVNPEKEDEAEEMEITFTPGLSEVGENLLAKKEKEKVHKHLHSICCIFLLIFFSR